MLCFRLMPRSPHPALRSLVLGVCLCLRPVKCLKSLLKERFLAPLGLFVIQGKNRPETQRENKDVGNLLMFPRVTSLLKKKKSIIFLNHFFWFFFFSLPGFACGPCTPFMLWIAKGPDVSELPQIFLKATLFQKLSEPRWLLLYSDL